MDAWMCSELNCSKYITWLMTELVSSSLFVYLLFATHLSAYRRPLDWTVYIYTSARARDNVTNVKAVQQGGGAGRADVLGHGTKQSCLMRDQAYSPANSSLCILSFFFFFFC